MKDIHYDFVDFDSVETLNKLGKTLGGVLSNKTLRFNNEIASGELSLTTPEAGIWIRKWKLTTFTKVVLHKLPAPPDNEKKIHLIYLLNPTIFSVSNRKKKVKVNSSRNNIFITSDIPMEFSVMPKHPFYVLDIALTTSWLFRHFHDAEPAFKESLNQLLHLSRQPVMVEPCSIEEYKNLRELEVSVTADVEESLFIRSRVYCLIANFFSKIINRDSTDLVQKTIHYEQIMRVENIITRNVKELPKIETIAKEVNMSVSSLLRQFKLIYRKSIHEYYVEKKMELAKKMILEKKTSIKEMAAFLGYNQASPFIEIFSKHHGYSPGTLKLIST
jgi:AraC-like DNA-binding protein